MNSTKSPPNVYNSCTSKRSRYQIFYNELELHSPVICSSIYNSHKFLFPSLILDCSCSSFVNPNGYGKCLKDYKLKGPICYVNDPSNCNDLSGSSESNDYPYSWEACKYECKSNS